MGGLLHLAQRGGVAAPPSPLLTVPNVTAHPSMAVLLYDGPLLCGFNAAIKELKSKVGGKPTQLMANCSDCNQSRTQLCVW